MSDGSEIRVIWCSHRHDEGEACNSLCRHDSRCQGQDAVEA